MSTKELTINKLKLSKAGNLYERFLGIYRKLFDESALSDNDILIILSIAVIFTNQREDAMRHLGYRAALAYGNKTKDFTPLYDLALNTGLMPVVALLQKLGHTPRDQNLQQRDSFLTNIIDSYIDNFRQKEIVLTEQQYLLNLFFEENFKGTCTVVAPTSYGKSELIVSAIEKARNQRICIVVPSKSLLAQTRKRIIDKKIDWVRRIVSHPEMHRQNDHSSVYVLTQERLTRILNQDKKMSYDIVIVDEAHNLLSKDERSELLASVIRILDYRNPSTAFKFLTPFLTEASSIKVKNAKFEPTDYSINEYVKSESIYLADFRNGKNYVRLYDHFVDEYFDRPNNYKSYFSYILSHQVEKNVVYLNQPKHIQEFSLALTAYLPEIKSPMIAEAIAEIGGVTSERYHLLHCMRKGVLYHHGSMTESVRSYVEHLFRSCKEIKYLVTSSTLLEGVNLPADQMFLLSIKKGTAHLSRSQFKNLIGRVSRFGDIFNGDSPDPLIKLQPKIHVIGNDDYLRVANLESFLKKVMFANKKDKDKIENVLLDGTEINERNIDAYERVMTRLENLESGVTGITNLPVAETPVGLKLLEQNISEIDVFKHEHLIEIELNKISSGSLINNSNALMSLINRVFISFFNEDSNKRVDSLARLQRVEAQTFYAMFLDWKIKQLPLPAMIHAFIRYWDALLPNTQVFVGSWGDETKDAGFRKVYTRVSNKSLSEKINLAIVRIKEEEDFFDHQIFRFIEVLNELNILDQNFYLSARYGTTDPKVIALIKNGFSRGVALLLLNEYPRYITFNGEDEITITPEIHQHLQENRVGFLQRNEVALNVPTS